MSIHKPISEKLASLPFKKVAHQVTTMDAQPIIGVDNNQAVALMVTGAISTSRFKISRTRENFVFITILQFYILRIFCKLNFQDNFGLTRTPLTHSITLSCSAQPEVHLSSQMKFSVWLFTTSKIPSDAIYCRPI